MPVGVHDARFMELSKVKLSSSLSWLSGSMQEQQSMETAKHVLLNPYGVTSGYKELKGEVVALLTAPNLYRSAYKAIFPSETPDSNSFWPLIHGLARHGIYLLEDDDVAVNHSVLAQTAPFRKGSHLALLDGLMTAYASSIVSVERVVKAIRRISTFNPSRELPCGVEDSLLLWLNKVSGAVGREQREEAKRKLRDPDARQRRRNRLRLISEGEMIIPRAADVCSAVVDGQCLAALLVHYGTNGSKWSDFRFSGKPLSRAHCLQNLAKVRDVCNAHLPPPAFHLAPEDLLEFGQSEPLKANILAFLAHLFRCFELGAAGRPLAENRRVSSKGTASVAAVANGAVDHNSGGMKLPVSRSREGSRENLASRRSLFRREHLARCHPPSHHSLSSYSTSHLPSERHTGVGGANATIASSFRRLSSFSTSALLETTHRDPLVPGSTVFTAPVRTSLTSKQAVALAGFHQQPKPSAFDLDPTRRNPHHQVITVSTDNLRIREQMMNERQRRRRRQPVRYSASLSSSSSSSSSSSASSPVAELSVSGEADVSGNSTESWHLSTRRDSNPNPIPGSNGNTNAATYASRSQKSHSQNEATDERNKPVKDTGRTPLQFSANSPEIEKVPHCTADDRELRASFTISKAHTLASASAAGLPIIKPALEREDQRARLSSDSKDTGDGIGKVGPVSGFLGSASRSQEVERKNPHSRSSSGSSNGSAASGVRVLRLFRPVPKPDESPDRASGCLPPEILQVRQRMREREREIRREQARLEEQLALERKRFHQQVFEVLTQEQESKVAGPSKAVPRGGSVVDPLESQARSLESVPQSEGKSSEARDDRMGIPNGEPHPKVPVLSEASVEERHSDSELDSGTEDPIRALSTAPHPPAAIALATSQQTPLKTDPQAILRGLERNEDRTVPTVPTSTAEKPGSPSPDIPTDVQCSTTGRQPPRHQSQGDPAHTLRDSPGPPSSRNPGAAVQRNPWTADSGAERQEHVEGQKKAHSESVLRQREQQVRARLEERERARRTAMEQRRRELARKRTLQELSETSEPTMQASEDTLHFKLSEQPWERADTAPPRGDFLTHNGPECYVRPQAKSNRKIISNAICHVCLAGEVNMSLKQRALAELELSSANHFFVLFRDTIGCKFRALYSYTPEANHVSKIFGSGPKVIKQHMISGLYKYNCGARAFKPILSKSFSISIDAITIKNEYWTSKKVSSKPPSGAVR